MPFRIAVSNIEVSEMYVSGKFWEASGVGKKCELCFDLILDATMDS